MGKKKWYTHVVIWFLPICHACKGLDNTHALDAMLEDLDARIRRQLLARRIEVWFPEFAACHDEAGEQEWARRAHMLDCVQDRIEQADERVEPEEETVRPSEKQQPQTERMRLVRMWNNDSDND